MENDTFSESAIESRLGHRKADVEKLISYILGQKGYTLKSIRKEINDLRLEGKIGTQRFDLINNGFNDLLDVWKPYGSFEKFPQLTDLTLSIVGSLMELMNIVIHREHGPLGGALADLNNEFRDAYVEISLAHMCNMLQGHYISQE